MTSLKINLPAINLNDYNYDLPESKIALYPSEDRSGSRLLVANVSAGEISHRKFSDIVSLIPEKSLLVLNSTKVIAARLFMVKPSGGRCELLLVEPVKPSGDPQTVMSASGSCAWNCIIGGRSVKEGLNLRLADQPKGSPFVLWAKVIQRTDNYGIVEFTWEPVSLTFSHLLHEIGKIPLPPYIQRDTESLDYERYQTVYARRDGSVAAPTAGLHFTDPILKELEAKGISRAELVLHVGPGTFIPVSGDDPSKHIMHSERLIIAKNTVITMLHALESRRRIIAVGTTSVRTLETLFWIGAGLLNNIYADCESPDIAQWDPYRTDKYEKIPTSVEALQAIAEYADKNNLEEITAKTALFIMPGYKFRIINGMITNFHLPKSTLLLLVAAFTGNRLRSKIYSEALSGGYRFLSYGDSSLILDK